MSRSLQAQRLNLQTFAQDGLPLKTTTPISSLERLADETQGLAPDQAVSWEARGELRPQAGADDQVWLHLHAEAAVPLACQRCMATVTIPVAVDQTYRFVATEEIAMAEDDQSEEDLLVTEPQFDLLALIEDELLMALPLVPMHEVCPDAPALRDEPAAAAPEKPNPFAVLAQLKAKK
jgi:uncharacterized protein